MRFQTSGFSLVVEARVFVGRDIASAAEELRLHAGLPCRSAFSPAVAGILLWFGECKYVFLGE